MRGVAGPASRRSTGRPTRPWAPRPAACRVAAAEGASSSRPSAGGAPRLLGLAVGLAVDGVAAFGLDDAVDRQRAGERFRSVGAASARCPLVDRGRHLGHLRGRGVSEGPGMRAPRRRLADVRGGRCGTDRAAARSDSLLQSRSRDLHKHPFVFRRRPDQLLHLPPVPGGGCRGTSGEAGATGQLCRKCVRLTGPDSDCPALHLRCALHAVGQRVVRLPSAAPQCPSAGCGVDRICSGGVCTKCGANMVPNDDATALRVVPDRPDGVESRRVLRSAPAVPVLRLRGGPHLQRRRLHGMRREHGAQRRRDGLRVVRGRRDGVESRRVLGSDPAMSVDGVRGGSHLQRRRLHGVRRGTWCPTATRRPAFPAPGSRPRRLPVSAGVRTAPPTHSATTSAIRATAWPARRTPPAARATGSASATAATTTPAPIPTRWCARPGSAASTRPAG